MGGNEDEDCKHPLSLCKEILNENNFCMALGFCFSFIIFYPNYTFHEYRHAQYVLMKNNILLKYILNEIYII